MVFQLACLINLSNPRHFENPCTWYATFIGQIQSKVVATQLTGSNDLTKGEAETTVDDSLPALKDELERFGAANDSATAERARCMLNITRDTGEFLFVLVCATAARRILEIGTSNGYSTLWLADAAREIGGSVTTVEFAEYKIGLASANFARSGLSQFISLVHEDAGRFLQRSDPSAYDFIFLDSERGVFWLVATPASRPPPRRLVDRGQRDISRGTVGSLHRTGNG